MLTGAVEAGPTLTREGAFPATIDLPGRRGPDATSFVTGLALRALRGRTDAEAERVRAPMLDFVARCETGTGAFAFWSDATRPIWAARIPADVDDTAICLTELHLAGRVGRADATRRALRLSASVRVRDRDGPRPPWIPEGAFRTWLVPPGSGGNPVDCAANANLLALFAVLGLRDAPGARAAVALIEAGLRWAGEAPARLRALTPFYPDPGEFRLAVEHAVACGCRALEPAADGLRRLTGGRTPGPDAVLCSPAYGLGGWRSPALAAIRTDRREGASTGARRP